MIDGYEDADCKGNSFDFRDSKILQHDDELPTNLNKTSEEKRKLGATWTRTEGSVLEQLTCDAACSLIGGGACGAAIGRKRQLAGKGRSGEPWRKGLASELRENHVLGSTVASLPAQSCRI